MAEPAVARSEAPRVMTTGGASAAAPVRSGWQDPR
jgi:hypothetical protein